MTPLHSLTSRYPFSFPFNSFLLGSPIRTQVAAVQLRRACQRAGPPGHPHYWNGWRQARRASIAERVGHTCGAGQRALRKGGRTRRLEIPQEHHDGAARLPQRGWCVLVWASTTPFEIGVPGCTPGRLLQVWYLYCILILISISFSLCLLPSQTWPWACTRALLCFRVRRHRSTLACPLRSTR